MTQTDGELLEGTQLATTPGIICDVDAARIPAVGISIQELAETCLRRQPYQALRRVSCEAKGGLLILRGRVPTYHLKQLAQTSVADVPGLKGIANNIQVLPKLHRP